ncbi:hypothetical protein VRC18_04585 [Pseudomonas trivialis]|uniref:hypothetical protein n=1 Tax=Pseudomonas trivialis TaxID=200450 RepID=UPI0030D128F7
MNKPGLVPGLFFGARANASQLSERHAQGNEDQLWELACLRRRFFGVPIRFCGNGCWRFRPDYGSLWKSLRSASVFDGAPPDQDQERGGLRADRNGLPNALHLIFVALSMASA